MSQIVVGIGVMLGLMCALFCMCTALITMLKVCSRWYRDWKHGHTLDMSDLDLLMKRYGRQIGTNVVIMHPQFHAVIYDMSMPLTLIRDIIYQSVPNDVQVLVKSELCTDQLLVSRHGHHLCSITISSRRHIRVRKSCITVHTPPIAHDACYI